MDGFGQRDFAGLSSILHHERETHIVESGLVLGLIATLMITYLLERGGLDNLNQPADRVNWWIHYLVLCGFPSLIAYGKHFHLVIGPVNVVLKHMTELPSDRVAASGDFDMGDEDDDDDEAFEAEYARVGMPNGVADFSFHTLLDPAACIECGRCNDVCPSADAGLKPREHFVLAFRDHTATAMQLAEMAPPDTVATCTQCRACDTVCPVGNRPSRAGLELRGRMSFAPEDYEHDYPPAPVRDGGEDPVGATGNIFGEDPSSRERFIEKNDLPIYDPEEHEVLFVLGCQNSHRMHSMWSWLRPDYWSSGSHVWRIGRGDLLGGRPHPWWWFDRNVARLEAGKGGRVGGKFGRGLWSHDPDHLPSLQGHHWDPVQTFG